MPHEKPTGDSNSFCETEEKSFPFWAVVLTQGKKEIWNISGVGAVLVGRWYAAGGNRSSAVYIFVMLRTMIFVKFEKNKILLIC